MASYCHTLGSHRAIIQITFDAWPQSSILKVAAIRFRKPHESHGLSTLYAGDASSEDLYHPGICSVREERHNGALSPFHLSRIPYFFRRLTQGCRISERLQWTPCIDLKKFFEKPWWTRMWTVQELVVARSDPQILCGEALLPWKALSNIIFYLTVDSRPTKSSSFNRNVTSLHNLDSLKTYWTNIAKGERNQFARLGLDNLLVSTSDRDAGDPRDHIYAILSLCSEPDNVLLPNCEESVELVYQKVMVQALKIRQGFRLAILSTKPSPIPPTFLVSRLLS